MEDVNNVVRIRIRKDRARIATAEKLVSSSPVNEMVDRLFYFHKISLNPPVMFEHLSGMSLSTFLDHSEVTIQTGEGKQVWSDLRYVHGRSEVMRGSHEVTSVLLAKLKDEKIPTNAGEETFWLTQLPDIYREFMKTLN
jgi:hypothetical protein